MDGGRISHGFFKLRQRLAQNGWLYEETEGEIETPSTTRRRDMDSLGLIKDPTQFGHSDMVLS